MIDHPPHVTHAVRALAEFDGARTGSEIGRLGVKVASALRVLLYEPADGYQGEPGARPDNGDDPMTKLDPTNTEQLADVLTEAARIAKDLAIVVVKATDAGAANMTADERYRLHKALEGIGSEVTDLADKVPDASHQGAFREARETVAAVAAGDMTAEQT